MAGAKAMEYHEINRNAFGIKYKGTIIPWHRIVYVACDEKNIDFFLTNNQLISVVTDSSEHALGIVDILFFDSRLYGNNTNERDN